MVISMTGISLAYASVSVACTRKNDASHRLIQFRILGVILGVESRSQATSKSCSMAPRSQPLVAASSPFLDALGVVSAFWCRDVVLPERKERIGDDVEASHG